MSRAFLNMLTNSCHAIEERARSAGKDYESVLTIGSRAAAAEGYEFWIRDNGTGIPDDIMQHMCEPFVTTKGTGQGSGPGLSLCMEIITRHQGHISVQSEVGEFTSITIQLPFDPAAERPATGDSDEEAKK